jgi:hypothetical protein
MFHDYLNLLNSAKHYKLSEHFTLYEAIYSKMAIKHQIDNSGDRTIVNNCTFLANELLEPVRGLFNVPILGSSWYRCDALNNIIKGKKTSDHLLGLAKDIYKIGNLNLFECAEVLAEKVEILEFDQLIFEHKWIHLSKRKNGNRKQVLHTKLINSKLVYKEGLR